MKGFNLHINPRYKHLYLVAIFLGIMLVAGITVGFMTGKLVNPFSKADSKLVCDEKCMDKCGKDKRNCKVNCQLQTLNSVTSTQACIKACDALNCQDECCQEVEVNDTSQPKPIAAPTPPTDTPTPPTDTPTPPTDTPTPDCGDKKQYNPITKKCECKNTCGDDEVLEPDCSCKKFLGTQNCQSASNYTLCVTCCQNKYPNRVSDKNNCIAACGPLKPAAKPQPCKKDADCNSNLCNTTIEEVYCKPDNFCGCRTKDLNKPTSTPTPTPTSTPKPNTPPSYGGNSGSTSGGSFSSSCTNNYVIPVVNTLFTEANNSCSNNVYTSTYKISFKTNPAVDPNTNKQVSECGGGHFKLTLLFPSFVAGHITSANRGGQIQGNKVVWPSIHIYDNANFGPFIVTINQPKDSTPQQTFQEKIIVQNVDHTRPQPAQKALATNVGACYTASSTDSGGGGSTITPTPTPTPTYNNDSNNNYYTPPNTGLLDEHPMIVVALIAGLAILEATFGVFSKAIISIKKLVD